MSQDTPRIYVASLSDYNNGVLHGAWIDADQEPDQIYAEVAAMLATSPVTGKFGEVAEEYAIHDYDGFPGELELGEWESFERLHDIAEALSKFPAVVVAHYFTDNPKMDAADVVALIEDQFVTTVTDEVDEREAVANVAYDYISESDDLPQQYQAHQMAIARSMANDWMCGGDYGALYEGAGVWHVLNYSA
ncbi:antirestriction protein ArdA [Streptomyces sp. H39-S7]|uniref:antirestriction protein ArdA n=1 Tax=Streptomyces sp. H39-S7 TaxID=3004357 RepID=UPI0022AEEB00|nr:antirestriction protein ArdA [Streptomyces sp. H39-S7]MCZ4119055.1 antirestriction protein ArdA [Streptomyces sp. H39-S7]